MLCLQFSFNVPHLTGLISTIIKLISSIYKGSAQLPRVSQLDQSDLVLAFVCCVICCKAGMVRVMNLCLPKYHWLLFIKNGLGPVGFALPTRPIYLLLKMRKKVCFDTISSLYNYHGNLRTQCVGCRKLYIEHKKPRRRACQDTQIKKCIARFN